MLEIVLTMFVVLFAFLAGGLWIGWTLAVTGTVLLAVFRDIPLDKLLAQYAWNILTTQELLALPLFIVMGEILFRTKLSQSLFRGLTPWAGLLPGRLLHVNVIGCSIFAAISACHCARGLNPGSLRACASSQAHSSSSGMPRSTGMRIGCVTCHGVSISSSMRFFSGSRK